MVFLLVSAFGVDLFYYVSGILACERHVTLLVHRHYGVVAASCFGSVLTALEAGVVTERNAGWVDVVGAVAVHGVSPT
jgi:hypothetical protein